MSSKENISEYKKDNVIYPPKISPEWGLITDAQTLKSIKGKLTDREYTILKDSILSDSMDFETKSYSLYKGNELILQLNQSDSLLCRFSYMNNRTLSVTFTGSQDFEKLSYDTWMSIKQTQKKIRESEKLLSKIQIDKELKLYKVHNGNIIRSYTVKTVDDNYVYRLSESNSIYKLDIGIESIVNDENGDYCVNGALRNLECTISVPINVDYDYPNLKKIEEFVLNDYSSKVLSLFRDNPYSMPTNMPHLYMYKMIAERWNNQVTPENTLYLKEVMRLYDGSDDFKISKHVASYIQDYMQNNYLGKDIEAPTYRIVNQWLGGGESPYLYVYLTKYGHDEQTYLSYKLVR